MDSETFFKVASRAIGQQAVAQSIYANKCKQALMFAEGTVGAAWNGMYLMGLAIAGLELVPMVSLVEMPTYYVKAPPPHDDDPCAWETSYIVEIDAFNK